MTSTMEDQGATTIQVDPRFSHLSDEHRTLLAQYVGDMVAVDSDIEAALDRQLAMTKNDTALGPMVRGFHDSVRDQRNMMISLRDALGEEEAGNALKEKGASVLGTVMGVIDKVRSEGVSKALRDDYTAFNLAAIGYTMLMTTAKAVGSPDIVTASEFGFTVYSTGAKKITDVMPSVVLAELASKNVYGGDAIADEVHRFVESVWQSESQQSKGTGNAATTE